MWIRNVFVVAVVVLTNHLKPLSASGDESLCTQAFAGYRILIESIDTFECEIEVTTTKGGTSVVKKGIYFKRGDNEKYVAIDSNKKPIVQTARNGEIVKQISNAQLNNVTLKRGLIQPYNGRFLTDSDPWGILGFRDFQYLARLSERQKVNQPFKRYQAVATDNAGDLGHHGIIAKRTLTTFQDTEAMQETSEFDASYNYLRTMIEKRLVIKQLNSITTKRLRKVREVAPAIYLPQEIETVTRDLKTNQVKSTQLARLSSIKVNHRLNAASVELKFPQGVKVRDEINRIEYVAGEDGKPAGPTRPLPQVIAPKR